MAGPVTYQRAPQALFAGESLAQALRQLLVYGRDGLPVLSADGRQVQGWVTNSRVLQAVARQIHTSQAQATQAQLAADWALPDPETALREPPTPLPGYQMLEISVANGSPAAGATLGAIAWPPGCTPVAIVHGRAMRDPDPEMTLSSRGPDHPAHKRTPGQGGQRNHPAAAGGLPPASLCVTRLIRPHSPAGPGPKEAATGGAPGRASAKRSPRAHLAVTAGAGRSA